MHLNHIFLEKLQAKFFCLEGSRVLSFTAVKPKPGKDCSVHVSVQLLTTTTISHCHICLTTGLVPRPAEAQLFNVK